MPFLAFFYHAFVAILFDVVIKEAPIIEFDVHQSVENTMAFIKLLYEPHLILGAVFGLVYI